MFKYILGLFNKPKPTVIKQTEGIRDVSHLRIEQPASIYFEIEDYDRLDKIQDSFDDACITNNLMKIKYLLENNDTILLYNGITNSIRLGNNNIVLYLLSTDVDKRYHLYSFLNTAIAYNNIDVILYYMKTIPLLTNATYEKNKNNPRPTPKSFSYTNAEGIVHTKYSPLACDAHIPYYDKFLLNMDIFLQQDIVKHLIPYYNDIRSMILINEETLDSNMFMC